MQSSPSAERPWGRKRVPIRARARATTSAPVHRLRRTPEDIGLDRIGRDGILRDGLLLEFERAAIDVEPQQSGDLGTGAKPEHGQS